MNSFGKKWTFTSFGESHGAAIGGVLDGVPAGLHIDFALIRKELERRAGKGFTGASPRAKNEPDEVEWLSGVLDGVTLGTPIGFIIRNKDARSEDYEWLKHSYRVGHADKVYEQKYGIRDWRGGGRASPSQHEVLRIRCLAETPVLERGTRRRLRKGHRRPRRACVSPRTRVQEQDVPREVARGLAEGHSRTHRHIHRSGRDF